MSRLSFPPRLSAVIAARTPSIRFLLLRLADHGGQTMAEYGILITVIAIIVVVAAITLGGSISHLFASSASHV